MPLCLHVATRKGLFTIAPSGRESWAVSRVSFLAENVSIVLPDPRDGTLYAALEHGHFGAKVQRSGDGGATWEEVATPAYPPQPEGEVEKDGIGRVLEWKLKRVWALEGGHPDEPGVLWCGTIPGGLFRSEDRGASWT